MTIFWTNSLKVTSEPLRFTSPQCDDQKPVIHIPSICAQVVLENSCRADEHECPFGRTSVELVKLLCEILHIGEPPSEQGQNYHPMFFTHDRPFEEFYCICIVLLNKTWKEMRATTEDFVKVNKI